MWKKTEDEASATPAAATPAPSRPAPAKPSSGGPAAVIGSSIRIQGELSGGEDLRIEGQVEGKVDLPNNDVVVGEQGRVKADIVGRTIRVEGRVEGNLTSGEQIFVSRSGNVRGNITAPRVSLEDGAQFKGSIDMEPGTSKAPPAKPSPSTKEQQKPAGSGSPKAASAGGGGQRR
ncbi:MAG: polymer-forming cytoskeletal protein [Acidobacteriota bacterium]